MYNFIILNINMSFINMIIEIYVLVQEAHFYNGTLILINDKFEVNGRKY